MPKLKKQSPLESANTRSALTPEAEERQMISLAIDRAKQQLIDGTASAQVIVHFLKLGATTAQLEKEKLERENELLKAKADSLKAEEKREELYTNAINAMRDYSGYGQITESEDI